MTFSLIIVAVAAVKVPFITKVTIQCSKPFFARYFEDVAKTGIVSPTETYEHELG